MITNNNRLQKFLKILFLGVIACFVMAPILIVVIISFKTEPEFMKTNFMPGFPLRLDNYVKVWKDADIPGVTFTSLTITVFAVLGQVFIGSLAAYALTSMKFRHAKLFSALFLIPLVFAIQTVIFPLFMIYKELHLLNTRFGLIIIYIATGLATCIFIFTKFMQTVSKEILESAQIDGAGHFRSYFQIMLPLTKAQISTIGIINGLGVWNDFFLPLMMFTDGSIKTLPLSMYTFTTEYGLKWTLVSADIVFMMLPMVIIYLLLQKYIIEGVAAGAVKG